MGKFYVGIDIGGSSIKFGFFDANKKLIDKTFIETPKFKSNQEKRLLDAMIKVVDDYIEKNSGKFSKKDLCGIGFAFPGPVVDNKVIKAVNINWKKKYDIVGAVKKHYNKNVKVRVGNDANFATLGEYHFTLKKKYKSICMLTLGTGIGGGIIVDGKLIEGRSGAAGEICHVKVDYSKDAIKCNCGNVGCLETVTSAYGIARTYNRLYNTNVADGAKYVIRKAKTGDKKALKSLTYSFEYLTMAISMIMLTYEPEVILIGGGVSNEGKFITDMITKLLKSKVYITRTFPKIMNAKLKNDAGIYGAVVEL